MATSVAEDIAQMINDDGISTLGTDLFISQFPETPDALVATYHGPGSAPNPAFQRDFQRVQVRVRGSPNDYSGAYDKADAIKSFLLGHDPHDINSKCISSFLMATDIILAGYDENRRPLLTINFDLVVDNAGGRNRTQL